MFGAYRLRLLLLLLLFLAACTRAGDPTATSPVAPTATAAATALPTPLPTAPAQTASPSPSPAPGSAVALDDPLYTLQPPLLVDGERGLIFARGAVDGTPATVVVYAGDGALHAVFPPVGLPALDRQRNLLLLDTATGDSPLLAAGSGDRVAAFAAPPGEPAAPPQLDPALGYAYLFRDQTIYRYSLRDQSRQDSTPAAVPYTVCGDVQGSAPIVASDYDLINHTLYLTFVTYVCTPWVSATIVAYDGATLQERGRLPTDSSYQAVPFAGTLHGTSSPRVGPLHSWAWDTGSIRQEDVNDVSRLGGIVADWGRGMVFEVAGNAVLVRNATTRALVDRVELPFLDADAPEGPLTLAAHDPHSDNLYFLSAGGRLYLWPAENLLVPHRDAPLIPAPSPLPAAPVRRLALAAAATGAPVLAGLWSDPACPGDVTRLYLFAGARWSRLAPDATQPCTSVTALAFSPTFAGDDTLFAATAAAIVYRSADAGQRWLPSDPLPPGTIVDALYPSARFSADHTLFAHAGDGLVYRSTTGGQQWQPLAGSWDTFALAPAAGDGNAAGTVAAGAVAALASRGATLYRTADGGTTWEEVGPTPGATSLSLLAVAPASPPGSTAFTLTATGHFYRTSDGGLTWEERFVVVDDPPLQIALTSDANGAPFLLLLHGGDVQVVYDGARKTASTTWPAAATALAFSPSFVSDGLVYVGTATGLVLRLQAGPIP